MRLRLKPPSAYRWSDITQPEAVARLFPEVARTGVSLDGMMPGRYWPAWKLPPKPTELDKEILRIIDGERAVQFLPRDHLARLGIMCPFHAWRAHTVFAAHHARATFDGTMTARKRALEEELTAWDERIRAGRRLLSADPEAAAPKGSLYLGADDFGGTDPGTVHLLREARLKDLPGEILRDEGIRATVTAELDRLKRMGEGRSGKNAPDAWRTPFFVYLAGLWVATTDEGSPDPAGPLGRVLEEATHVISAGRSDIREWGQAKALDRRFKNAPAGEGFRTGDRGMFDLEAPDRVAERGRAITDLMDIAEGKQRCSEQVQALAWSALMLRDHCEGPLALIMREAVLREALTREDMLPPRVSLQLGWMQPARSETVTAALRTAVDRAGSGDLAAVLVVELASWLDAAGPTLRKMGWTTPYAGRRQHEFLDDLEARARRMPEEHMRDGDFKAFAAAMSLAEAWQPISA